jgi:hypothetical protein
MAVKRLPEGKPEQERIERDRLRWMDVVEMDLRNRGV